MKKSCFERTGVKLKFVELLGAPGQFFEAPKYCLVGAKFRSKITLLGALSIARAA
jgi:hypothetical protein